MLCTVLVDSLARLLVGIVKLGTIVVYQVRARPKGVVAEQVLFHTVAHAALKRGLYEGQHSRWCRRLLISACGGCP